MNTRILVTLSLFVGIGAVLHVVIPSFGMKPDMSLTMMFLGILLFPKAQYVLLLGLSTGFISALTTTFPSGQIPNIIDKPITAFLFFGAYLLVKRFSFKFTPSVLACIGTLISGTIFLGSALFIFGLPEGFGFMALFVTVVIPTSIVNTILLTVLYPIVLTIGKRSNLVTTV
ncbi:tryptophan transporter [Bacillus sp. BGMRC 2118]|nr:tryptophan transporter [Bacillus sp. BGMRC 2118]